MLARPRHERVDFLMLSEAFDWLLRALALLGIALQTLAFLGWLYVG